MNKATVKNVLIVLVVLAMATMTACNLTTPADTGSTVEVVLDGIGGAGRGLSFGYDATWVKINVVDSSGVQKFSDYILKTNNIWKGSIHISGEGTMRFIATAGFDEGKVQVDWFGNKTLVMGTSGILTIGVGVPTADGTEYGPAGGKVFYDKKSYSAGWRYLEAAPSNQSAGIAWITGGTTQTTANGNTSTALGTGKANTDFMVAQTGNTGGAAKVCKEYACGGYSDWFLPSKDELNAMYLKSGTIDSLASAWYWSSSEYNLNFAWKQNFNYDDGAKTYVLKSYTYYVRAVRAF